MTALLLKTNPVFPAQGSYNILSVLSHKSLAESLAHR